MKNIKLKKLKFKDVSYRAKLLSDEKTMEYNKGYSSKNPNYNSENGTIRFPEEQWKTWYNKVKKDKTKFFAFIYDPNIKELVGYVQFSYKPKEAHYGCSVLLESKHRGKGYSSDAFRLMLNKAFNKYKVSSLWYDVSINNNSIRKMLENVGFKYTEGSYTSKKFGKDETLIPMCITRESYLKEKNENK